MSSVMNKIQLVEGRYRKRKRFKKNYIRQEKT